MPLYEYQCPECGATREVFRRVDQRNDAILCGECLGDAQRAITSPSLKGDTVSKY